MIIMANLEITDRKMHLSASASSGESIRLLRKNPFQKKVGLKPNVTKSGQTKAKNKSFGCRNRFVFVSSHTFVVRLHGSSIKVGLEPKRRRRWLFFSSEEAEDTKQVSRRWKEKVSLIKREKDINKKKKKKDGIKHRQEFKSVIEERISLWQTNH